VSQATVARVRRRSLVVLLVILAAAGLAVVPRLTATSKPERGYLLRDAFDGTRLNAHRWRTCHWWADRGCTIASNDELETYWSRQARVRDGKLELVAERRDARASDGVVRPYMSGMISSGPGPKPQKPKFAFLYGHAEVRARLPTGKGLWSAIWLLPANRTSKPEIDVMESRGQDLNSVALHVHWRGSGGDDESDGKRVSQWGIGAGWHTFAIDWRPESLTWIIDGRRRWTVRGDAVPHTPMYLVVNLAVGGEWAGEPDSGTRFPNTLLVDSIKVWR
jgi:beta-glucanase (GH16 family)